MGKVIGYIGVLDITTASEESIKGIDRVKNVGMLLYSPGTAGLINNIGIDNLGTSLEIPEGYTVIKNHVEMDKNYFISIKEPISLAVLGKTIMKPDVSADDIERCIKDMIINGMVVCHKDILGAVQSRISMMNGNIMTYSGEYLIKSGKLNINNSFLKSINDNTELVLSGKLLVVEDIDEGLFSDKIRSINISGKATIREEYLGLVYGRLCDIDRYRVEVIPSGYIYIDSDLHLDQVSIKRFNHGKLYVTGMLELGSDITGEILTSYIDKIVSRDIIVCRTELKEAVYGCCDDVTSRVCDYPGKVHIIDGERRLTQPELQYTDLPISYIVQGEFTIADDVLPETFMEKVEHIDNFGEIICDAGHYGLVQAKMRISSGDVVEKGAHEGLNIGYLKL